MRTHPRELTVLLLAALVQEREREITDALVELLIATVHRIKARADSRVTKELINAFKRVTGKENILFKVAEAALNQPDDSVRQVISRRSAAASRRCAIWCTSSRPRARPTGPRCRPRCVPPTPTTTGAA